jgi:RHS repeat-associated protein
VTTETRPNHVEYAYTYESTTSRLKSVKDPNGNVKTYAYNLDDSLAGITYEPGTGVAATPSVAFTYDPVYNRVATMTDGTGTTAYAYYPTGVLGSGRLHSVDGPLDNDTITYAYDQLGRVNSRQIGSSANTQSQQFDSLGRLTQITNPLGNFVYSYVGVTGRPTSVTYPNGQQTTYAYLANLGDHRLQEIHNKKPGGATLSKFNYTYDSVGNITTWRQQNEANPAQVYEFGYDPADQLTAAILKSTDPTPVMLKRYYYAYDPAGNRTAEQIDDSVKSWTYNNMNQLVTEQAGGALVFKGTVNEPTTVTVGGKPANVTADNRFAGAAVVAPSGTTDVQVTATDYASPTRNTRTNTYRVAQSGTPKGFTFDSNGNLTSDGSKTYTWDAGNRLAEVKQGGNTLASFTYNKDGIRTSKTAGGVTTSYVLCDDSIIEERLSTGGTVRHLHGPGIDNALATIDAMGVASYYVRDHLGSIRQRTDVSGQSLLTRGYDAWGNLLAGASSGGWAFTGREWDSEIGLAYHRARYYQPSVARFITEDPIGFEGGVGLYAYVGNRPITHRDAQGLAGEACWDSLKITAVRDCSARLISTEGLCPGAGGKVEGMCGELRKSLPADLPKTSCGKGECCQDMQPVQNPFIVKGRTIRVKKKLIPGILSCTAIIEISGDFDATGSVGTCGKK